jgi:hypothetical protein
MIDGSCVPSTSPATPTTCGTVEAGRWAYTAEAGNMAANIVIASVVMKADKAAVPVFKVNFLLETHNIFQST